MLRRVDESDRAGLIIYACERPVGAHCRVLPQATNAEAGKIRWWWHSIACSKRWCAGGPEKEVLKLELIDISRAHFSGVPAH